MRGDPIVLGIDLATANARVLAVDTSTGQTVAQANAPVSSPVRTDDGSSTQQANYAEVVFALIKAVAADLGLRSRDVRAICTTGTSGTIVPCNNQGYPVGHALMYDDQRASSENDEIQANSPKGPYGALGRIVWLERNAPAQKYLTLLTW
ncbi:FGGY family carbohydrate kinase [Arthrobacter psychrolactophilus]